jgi:hypothetical protein
MPADLRTGSRTASGAPIAHPMSKRNNQIQKANLALAMAGGSTVKAWADANGVADRTARTWSDSPEVLSQIEDHRPVSPAGAEAAVRVRARRGQLSIVCMQTCLIEPQVPRLFAHP